MILTRLLSSEEISKHQQTVRAVVNRLLLSRRISDVQTERDDLYQVGWMILMKCLEQFDETRGVKFETYLSRSIYHAVNNELARLYKRKMVHIDWDICERHKDNTYLVRDIVQDSGWFTPDEQTVFWARLLHNTSYRQIERDTGIERKKASVMYRRVLAKIKETLGHE